MGMFNSIMVQCPHCQSRTEVQTKPGKMDQWNAEDAPDEELDKATYLPVRCVGQDCEAYLTIKKNQALNVIDHLSGNTPISGGDFYLGVEFAFGLGGGE